MDQYLEKSEKSTVFTDDLKTIIHIADSPNDVSLATRMIKRLVHLIVSSSQSLIDIQTIIKVPVLSG